MNSSFSRTDTSSFDSPKQLSVHGPADPVQKQSSTMPTNQGKKLIQNKQHVGFDQLLQRDESINQEFNLLLQVNKPQSDHTETYKMPSDSYEPNFSRQLSETDQSNSAKKFEESKDVKNSYYDQFAKSLQKQDAQKLQNQLDIIEEEVEENLDTKFQGFYPVKKKIEQRGQNLKDAKSQISGLNGGARTA
eukprot:403371296